MRDAAAAAAETQLHSLQCPNAQTAKKKVYFHVVQKWCPGLVLLLKYRFTRSLSLLEGGGAKTNACDTDTGSNMLVVCQQPCLFVCLTYSPGQTVYG